MHVFVYGTLKQGFGNHVLLKDSKFVSNGHTKEEYVMYSTGGFPVVAEAETGLHVSGEVYEITPEVLKRLDRLEGYPTMYDRQEVEIDLEGTGVYQTCWMYVGAPDFWDFIRLPKADYQEGMWTWK